MQSSRSLDDASTLSQLAQVNMMEIQGSSMALKQAKSPAAKNAELESMIRATIPKLQATTSATGATQAGSRLPC